MKNLLEIYSLAVCFVSVVAFVIISGFGAWGVMEWLIPDFAMSSYRYDCISSDEDYADCLKKQVYYDKNQLEIPTGEELTRQRLAKYQSYLDATKRSGKKTVAIISVVFLMILMIFLVHWSLASKMRRQN